MPPIWTIVLVTLDNGMGLLAKWDGEQWWMAEKEIPIANFYVINWRSVN